MGWSTPSTALVRDAEAHTLRVTHPFHPLYKQEFTLIRSRLAWGRWRAQYYDKEGVVRSLPAAWTNCGPVDPFLEASAGRSVLHVSDLVALCELVAGIGEEARSDV